ncbi:hypothetical protein [Rhodopila sp.]|uniref:hypothetical protein n=1 Tax=Rhodopila sp. TaxID=2480087 RepID=UPI003D11DD0C
MLAVYPDCTILAISLRSPIGFLTARRCADVDVTAIEHRFEPMSIKPFSALSALPAKAPGAAGRVLRPRAGQVAPTV